jgi:hypothetical protein
MNYKLNFKSYVMFMIFDYVMLYVYGTINRALHLSIIDKHFSIFIFISFFVQWMIVILRSFKVEDSRWDRGKMKDND